MKIALLTVFHDKNKIFINDYLRSVDNQSFKNFTLIIVNDKCSYKIKNLKKFKFKYKLLTRSNSPLKNRLKALNFCKKKYDLIVFSDADDTLFKDFILNIFNFFKNEKNINLAYSKLIYKESKKYLQFTKRKNFFILKDIINFNFLGHGSIILRKKLIPFFFNCAKEKPLMFDWYFILRYLFIYKKVFLIKNAKILYRTHKFNSLGPKRKLNIKNINQSIKYKKDTYFKLEKYFKKMNNKYLAQDLSKKRLKLEKLSFLIRDKIFFNKYLVFLKKKFLKRKKIYWFEEAIYSNSFLKIIK